MENRNNTMKTEGNKKKQTTTMRVDGIKYTAGQIWHKSAQDEREGKIIGKAHVQEKMNKD